MTIDEAKLKFILPDNLTKLGYDKDPFIVDLAHRSLKATDAESLQIQKPWIEWRLMAEYMACVEFARAALKAFPEGPAVSLQMEVSARYHSVGIVFFGQALLDTIATWIGREVLKGVGGGDRNFLKSRFRRELVRVAATRGTELFDRHGAFLDRLNKYRQIWIHTQGGGPRMYSTTWPDDPSSIQTIGIPVDPTFDPLITENMIARAEALVKEHGRHVYSPAEFADVIATPVKEIFFDALRLCLEFGPRS